ncbi:YesL family protein [Neobacillus sp. 179-C4.2 HS]|uniref:YesL family protein n=1 Tax=Neobacillus driksii TaxID=3035913 RepID=A0ABV4Z1N9_9BACI|nr:YesL family protein [Neobacillus sp. 179.-C4.2 HS]
MMETKGMLSGIYRVSEKVMMIAYTNILWILFSLLGFVLIGIMPATAAMFAVMRKLIMEEEEEVPIFNLFWNKYKQEFVKANLYGYLLLLVFAVFLLDIMLFQSLDGWLFTFLSILSAGLLLVFFAVVLYFIPLYVHYDLPFFQYIKTAFLLTFIHPIQTVIMIISGAVIGFILLLLPGSIFFFSGSLYCFIVTKTALKVFAHVEEQKEVLEGESQYGEYSI